MVRTNCPTQALSIYRDTKTGKTFNITADDVKSDLQKAAKALYDLSDEELAKFTCHSIRIGACCTLYSMGVPPEQIKKLLRWRSNCWMRYIRDLTTVANNQNAAITSAAELPCLWQGSTDTPIFFSGILLLQHIMGSINCMIVLFYFENSKVKAWCLQLHIPFKRRAGKEANFPDPNLLVIFSQNESLMWTVILCISFNCTTKNLCSIANLYLT